MSNNDIGLECGEDSASCMFFMLLDFIDLDGQMATKMDLVTTK